MTIYTDDFNRGSIGTTGPAGGTLINADGWTISSSAYVAPVNTGNFSYLLEDFGFANLATEISFVDGNADDEGIIVRYVDANNWIRLVCQAGIVYLQKNYAGSLGTMVYTSPGATTTLRLECNNSAYRFYADGVFQYEHIDGAGDFITATKHGLVAYQTTKRMDDWLVDTVPIAPQFAAVQRWRTPGTLVATPAEESLTHELGLAPAILGAVGGPVKVALEDEPTPPDIVAEIFRHPDYRTPLATLLPTEDPVDGTYEKNWQDRHNEAGGGGLSVPWRSELLDIIEPDDLCRFSYKGEAAMMVVLNDEDRHTVAATEAQQTTTFSGPGHLALMSEAVIYPSNGVLTKPVERDRVFNWTSPQYNDDGWELATSLGEQTGGDFTYWAGMPAGWPDPSADWIWAKKQNASYPELDEWSPDGSCYFRAKYTMPGDVARVAIFLTMDAAGELYLDSQLILSTDNGSADPTEIRSIFLDVTPGHEYTFAAKCTNDVDPEGDQIHNPAGVLVSVFKADTTGAITDVLFNTEHFDWKIVEYADPPGMTPGEVLRIVFEEAQFRGELDGWSWTFDDYVDSNGAPWPTPGDIGTKVGTDYLTFIGELVGAPWVDIRAQPGGLVIDAYNAGTMGGTVSLADFHTPTDEDDPLSGNITELRHRRRARTASRFLIGSKFPWRHYDATEVGQRVKTATLGLGAVPSEAEADRIALGQLGVYRLIRSAITVGIEPVGADDSPYLAFRNGDVVTVPEFDATPTPCYVRSITVTEDTQGKVTFALEVNDVFTEHQERYAATLKKMSNGTLAGDAPAAKVATPIHQLPTNAPNCCPPTPTEPG